MPATLAQLGRKHGTGKSAHGYLPHFDSVFSAFRDEPFEMLEIGVHEGASIRMWHEYFPKAQIVGADSKEIVLPDSLPRYTFERGSQADLPFLLRLAERHTFKLMIDDGSHFWGHQIFTFQTLFPRLEPGGIYVCEDIQTSYGEPAERYHGGASESAAAYFFRIAQVLTAGTSQEVKQVADPLLHFILKKIRAMTFIRHAVIITT